MTSGLARVSTAENPVLQLASELSERNPSLIIAGSVGRAAVMGRELFPLRPSGESRDIDIIRFGMRPELIDADVDVPLDNLMEGWFSPDGSYLLFPRDPSVQVPVRHPDIFTPQRYWTGDYAIATVHPEVLGRISTMQSIQRPKDVRAAREYARFLAGRTGDRLHTELLQPFDELERILSQRVGYQWYGRLHNAYHVMVPESARRRIDARRFVDRFYAL